MLGLPVINEDPGEGEEEIKDHNKMAGPGELKTLKLASLIHMGIAFFMFMIGIIQLSAVNHFSSHIASGLWAGVWVSEAEVFT